MTESTRRLADPTVSLDGKLVAKSTLTPQAMKARGAVAVPSAKVIPVIVVPGIMGSNLRVTRDEAVNLPEGVEHGDTAWAPPNNSGSSVAELGLWHLRDASQRQHILDANYLEVDDNGTIAVSAPGLGVPALRARGWGEVHWASYGDLLADLQTKLAQTYTKPFFGGRELTEHWKTIKQYDRKRWNATDMAALTDAELENFARFQYPVYACGYNWVQSNEVSADRLKKRVLEVIEFWTKRKFDCKQVVLVTHSMGGLVARACAKQIPDEIVGIVHGVMPALGAPLAYRRIACGTESKSPNKQSDVGMWGFAKIAGNTPALATPAMAFAGGAIELMPNHLYPSPWLFASHGKPDGTVENLCALQHTNIYDMYRDYQAWFAPVDIRLADPAGKYKSTRGAVAGAVTKVVNQAEKFHRDLLDTYYHPNTYAYYGADPEEWSYGTFRWVTHDLGALKEPLRALLPIGQGDNTFEGNRHVTMPKGTVVGDVQPIFFQAGMQDAPGDGTVSHQSGAGPKGKVKGIFRTAGYNHQGSYKNEHMLKLTHHLIVRIVQEAK